MSVLCTQKMQIPPSKNTKFYAIKNQNSALKKKKKKKIFLPSENEFFWLKNGNGNVKQRVEVAKYIKRQQFSVEWSSFV